MTTHILDEIFDSFVSVVEKSGDTKLSKKRNVSATWVAQYSCPDSCKLRGAGCYAETGRAALSTRRLNDRVFTWLQATQQTLEAAMQALRLEIAKAEARAIRRLTGLRKLRVHAVGDVTDNATAAIVGQAMVDHESKYGLPAWTYTHAWATIAKAAWNGARVLASCHTVDELRQARSLGYGVAITVPKHPTHTIYEFQGERIIPCPAQLSKAVDCEHCTLCQRPDWLRDQQLSIGFEPDRGTAAKVLPLMLLKAA